MPDSRIGFKLFESEVSSVGEQNSSEVEQNSSEGEQNFSEVEQNYSEREQWKSVHDSEECLKNMKK